MRSSCASISGISRRPKKLRKRTSLPRLRARRLPQSRAFQRRQRLLGLLQSQRRPPHQELPQDRESSRPVRRERPQRQRVQPLRQHLQGCVHLLPRQASLLPLRGPEQRLLRRLHRLRQQDPPRHRPRQGRGPASPFGPQLPALLPEPHRWPAQRHPAALYARVALQRQGNDIQCVPGRLRDQGKLAPVHRKACALPGRHTNIAPVALRKAAPASPLDSVRAARLHGSRRVLAVVVREVAIIKRRSGRSVLEREFPRPNPASRCMPGNRRRAVGRLSKSVTRRASASCIRFARGRASAQADAQRLSNRLRR
jgi:hypothetical protein